MQRKGGTAGKQQQPVEQYQRTNENTHAGDRKQHQRDHKRSQEKGKGFSLLNAKRHHCFLLGRCIQIWLSNKCNCSIGH